MFKQDYEIRQDFDIFALLNLQFLMRF